MIPELTPPTPPEAEADRSRPEADGMGNPDGQHPAGEGNDVEYLLDEQIGYLLRLANQRHLEIFNSALPTLTPTQFAVMVRLHREGDISQNELGRRVGMDAATTNGVIDRLARKKLVAIRSDSNDKRRLRISLTPIGLSAIEQAIPLAREITRQTLQPLDSQEATQLIELLKKLQK